MVVHRPTGAARNTEGKGGNEHESHGGSPVLRSVSTCWRKSSGGFAAKLSGSTKKAKTKLFKKTRLFKKTKLFKKSSANEQ
jgi:hypothetical protein